MPLRDYYILRYMKYDPVKCLLFHSLEYLLEESDSVYLSGPNSALYLRKIGRTIV
jgi:hypothetical protein